MLEFSFFEVFLCCAESEAESALERDNSNEHERRAQTWFFRTCARTATQPERQLLNKCPPLPPLRPPLPSPMATRPSPPLGPERGIAGCEIGVSHGGRGWRAGGDVDRGDQPPRRRRRGHADCVAMPKAAPRPQPATATVPLAPDAHATHTGSPGVQAALP